VPNARDQGLVAVEEMDLKVHPLLLALTGWL
jgi:hypothetical protein